jgi:hypothetical protein
VAMFTDDAFDPLQAVAQINNPVLNFPQDVQCNVCRSISHDGNIPQTSGETTDP